MPTKTVHEGAGKALVFPRLHLAGAGRDQPVPVSLPLDGGHLLWSLLEKFPRPAGCHSGRMYRYSSVGIVLLLFLVVNGVGNDISRLTG